MVLGFGSHVDSEPENTEMSFSLIKDVLEVTVQQSYTDPTEVQENTRLRNKQ